MPRTPVLYHERMKVVDAKENSPLVKRSCQSTHEQVEKKSISQCTRVTDPGRRLRPESPAWVICLDGSFFDVVV